MKRLLPIVAALLCAFVSCSTNQEPGKLKINNLGYYETRGVNVLVYSNNYQGVFCDEKTAGIEIVQRGVRIATGGAVRLMNTPEQWDIYASLTERTIDTLGGVINCKFYYPDFNFRYDIKAMQEGKGIRLQVILEQPLPANLVGKAGLNMCSSSSMPTTMCPQRTLRRRSLPTFTTSLSSML